MSRYVFEKKGTQGIYVVGWDNPLQTFFAEEFEDISDDMPKWETMMMTQKFVDFAKFSAHFTANTGALIPSEVQEELQRDFQRRSTPSALQQMIGNLKLPS